jgi:uncharacterized protein involved in tolerance to divalent cations
MNYYQVLISAETKEQAEKILDALLERKLVIGGPILEAPAKFWWKGKIVAMNYAYIMTYTLQRLEEEIIRTVEEVSDEEVPMVSLIPIETNAALRSLINETIG